MVVSHGGFGARLFKQSLDEHFGTCIGVSNLGVVFHFSVPFFSEG